MCRGRLDGLRPSPASGARKVVEDNSAEKTEERNVTIYTKEERDSVVKQLRVDDTPVRPEAKRKVEEEAPDASPPQAAEAMTDAEIRPGVAKREATTSPETTSKPEPKARALEESIDPAAGAIEGIVVEGAMRASSISTPTWTSIGTRVSSTRWMCARASAGKSIR